ncbi:MAG: sigma-70 family RNA polymerase sigma factor [Acidobacteria bacterium]|nr:sigma-70 family RNA polymerase sigma factor [Acidobacteriota bacterium]
MDVSDAALVAQTQAGDGNAFRVLVERHSRKIYRLAFRLTGNEADAEDVVQEAFLKAYRNLGNFNGQSQFSSWIYSIASNHALDLLKSRKRRPVQSLTEEQESSGPQLTNLLASGTPDPERLASGNEMRQVIVVALDEMTPQERVAFTLRHFEGRCMEEIGASLQLTTGATRNAVFRAVQKVRRALHLVEGGPPWRTKAESGT